MQDILYSFDEAAEKIGYRSKRKLFELCKEKQILDKEREPLSPYKYMRLFVVKPVKTLAGFEVKQTFVNGDKGLSFLTGVVAGARKTPETVRGRNTAAESQSAASRAAKTGTRPSA